MRIKPFGFYDQIVRMKHNADKFELRLRMVQYAKQSGVKPAARAFAATPKTIRKWPGCGSRCCRFLKVPLLKPEKVGFEPTVE